MDKILSLLASLSVALVALSSAADAHAGELALGAEAGVAVPVGAQGGARIGPAVDGFVGYRLHAGPIWIQPEAMGGYRHFGNSCQDAECGGGFGRLTGGARLGLGGLIQSQAYLHLGAGFGDVAGATFDAGVAADLKISLVFVGVHGGFGTLAVSHAPVGYNWVDLGGHVGVLF